MRHPRFAASVACGGVYEMPPYRPMETGYRMLRPQGRRGRDPGKPGGPQAPFNTRYAQALSRHQRADSRHG